MKRTALVAQEYRNRKVKAGEEFEVDREHIHLLLVLKRIVPVEGEVGFSPPPPPPVARKDLVSDESKDVSPDDTQPTYETRSMVAAPSTSTRRGYNRKVGT